MDGRIRFLAILTGLLLMQAPVMAASFPKKPILTNKSRFRIPFNADAVALQRMNAREIQLHVSRDSGTTWKLAQELPPDAGRFEFQATSDGEYWFSVKVLDGRNQLHPPAGSYETGLIVVVDSVAPTLELSLLQSSAGTALMSWSATDPHLDASTLKVEYQLPDSQQWEPVPLDAGPKGETSWFIGQAGMIHVRGSISDSAGNTEHTKSQLQIDAANEGHKKRTRRSPVANTPPVGDFQASNADLNSGTTRSAAPIEADAYQGPVITPQGGLPRYPQSRQQFSSNNRPLPDRNQWQPIQSESARISNASMDSSKAIQGHQQTAAAKPQSAPRTSSYSGSGTTGGSNGPHRVVASRKFQIDYRVENVGPSGIGGVELFITEDNGRKWWKYSDDPDNVSPFDVEVPRDGVYGFDIRSRSGAGLSNDPPAGGDAPAIVVAVDQTAPVAELLPIQQGRGANANRLLIRWKHADDFPSDKPVCLQSAPTPSGPWDEIFSWKEDTNGEFIWTVGPEVTSQVFIRLMVRDAAGNITRVDTPSPVMVDLQRPVARIVDIEPIAGANPQ